MKEQKSGGLKWHMENLAFVVYNLYYLGYHVNVLLGEYSVALFVMCFICQGISCWVHFSTKPTAKNKAFTNVGLIFVAFTLIFLFTNLADCFLLYGSAIAIISVIYEEEKLLFLPAVFEAICVISAFFIGDIFDTSSGYAVAKLFALLLQVFGVNVILYAILVRRRRARQIITQTVEESCRIPREYIAPESKRYQVYDLTQQISQSCMALRGRRPQFYVIDVNPELPRKLIGDINRIIRAVNNVIYFEMANQQNGTAVISFTFSKEHPNGGSLIISARFMQKSYSEDDYEQIDSALRRIDDGEITMQSQVGMEIAMAAAVVHLMNGKLSLNNRLEDGIEYLFSIPQIYQDNRPLLEGNVERTLFYISQNHISDERVLKAYNTCVENLDSRVDSDMVFCYTMHDFKNWLLRIEFKYLVLTSEDYLENQEYFSSLEGRYEVFIIKNSYEFSLVEGRYRHLIDRPAVITNIFVEVSEFLLHKNLSWSSQAATDAAYEDKAAGSTPLMDERIKHANVPTEEAYMTIAGGAVASTAEEAKPDESPSKLLDKSLGLVYCGGKEDLYNDVLREYAQRGANNYQDATKAFDAKDWQQYTVFVHGIKSSTLSIGAQEISDLAKQLEFAGKENNIEFIVANHDKLISMYKDLVNDLQNYFNITPVETAEEEESCEGLRALTTAEAQKLLEDFEQVAYTFDSDTMLQMIEGLSGCAYGGKSLKSLQNDMLRKIEKEDFLSALSLAQDVFY